MKKQGKGKGKGKGKATATPAPVRPAGPPGSPPAPAPEPPPGPPPGPTLSLQYHYFMVAKILMRIIINNEISLIMIFRFYYNNIDNFDVGQKYQYFFRKNINILAKNTIFLKKIYFKKYYQNFGEISLLLCQNIIQNITFFLA